MDKRTSYVTVHNLETGETRTLAPDDDLPDWADDKVMPNPDIYEEAKEQAPTPGPSQGVEDLIGDPSEDSLMKQSKGDLLTLAEDEGADSVSDSNTKAEIVSAIRATGYDGE